MLIENVYPCNFIHAHVLLWKSSQVQIFFACVCLEILHNELLGDVIVHTNVKPN